MPGSFIAISVPTISSLCWFIEEENAEGEKERKVYGVLTDCDLSSLVDSELRLHENVATADRDSTIHPYMAHELLTETAPVRLYRHNLESLFYIMLLMAARHTIRPPEGKDKPQVTMRESGRLPRQNWFDEPRCDVLGFRREALFILLIAAY